MFFFKKKINLKDSGIFDGFTDWHSHILPGVDDGIQTIEDSLAVLEEYERLGFKKVWLTPHVMEEWPNETKKLKERFEELKKAYKGSIELKLAAENMLDTLFEERLESNDFLPIGDEGNHLLVETSYYTPPYGMDEMLDKARSKGYHLILAHPERYRYMEEKDYAELKNKGILFQMNILSLTGAYGETARKKAELLISKGWVDFLGTDVHRLAAVSHHIAEPIKKKAHVDQLKDSTSRQEKI